MTDRTEQLSFAGSTGARLAGILHHPTTAPRGSILLAHCFTCSKDLHTMTRLARGLSDASYVVLRFDFTGIGESEGAFRDKTVSRNVADVARAAATLIERGYGPCGLLGHSLGGAAVLLAAEHVKTVRSIATLGAPSAPTHVRRLLRDAVDAAERGDEAVAEIAGRRFPISRRFLEDLEVHDQSASVATLGRPLLVLHAVDDEVVPVSEGERIFATATQPKGFLPLLDTDHLLTDRASAELALTAVISWFDRTLS